MGATQKRDVSVGLVQDFSESQKALGRSNIGATRVVYIDTTATNADILKIVLAGDTPVLRVVVATTASFFNLARVSNAGVVFVAVIDGKVVTYTCALNTWTRTEVPYRDQFTEKALDTTRVSVNADDEITTVGNIKLSYYFDNQAKLRLVWVPVSETQASLTIYSDHGYFSWANVTTSQPQAVGADNFANSTGQRETLRWYTDSTFVVLEFFYDETTHILHWRRVS